MYLQCKVVVFELYYLTKILIITKLKQIYVKTYVLKK